MTFDYKHQLRIKDTCIHDSNGRIWRNLLKHTDKIILKTINLILCEQYGVRFTLGRKSEKEEEKGLKRE